MIAAPPSSADRNPASGPPPHFQSLDVLRGFAVMGVCLYHLTVAYRAGDALPPPLLALALPLCKLGWFGVDLFFLISGYGLAAKLANPRHRGPEAAVTFAANRFWRIFPVYWFCSALVVLLAVAATPFNGLGVQSALPATGEAWAATAFLVGPLVRAEPVLPVVTWALSLEVGLYAITAVALVLRRWCDDRLLLGAALLLALANLAGWRPVFATLFTHWPEFVGGALMFGAVRQRWHRRRDFLVPASLAVLLLIAACWGPPRVAVTMLFAAGLVLCWPWDGFLARQPALRWAPWCGRISFPLFLLHVPVTMRLTNLGARLVPRESTLFVGVLLLALAAALALSWVVHRGIEVPCVARARRPVLAFSRPG